MNEEQIKDLIRKVLEDEGTANQFAVANTPYHTHNGIDSALLKFSNLSDAPSSYYGQAGKYVKVKSTENGLEFDTVTAGPTIYGGAVQTGGSADTPFPSGWTSSNTGAGNYTITHNLGTTNYIVVANGGTAREITTTASTNSFEVLTRNSSGTLTDGSFHFILLLT